MPLCKTMAGWYSTLLVLPILLVSILYCDATLAAVANTSNMGVLPVIVSRSSSATSSAATSESSSGATNTTQSGSSGSARMQVIKTLYGFQGFVYDIDVSILSYFKLSKHSSMFVSHALLRQIFKMTSKK